MTLLQAIHIRAPFCFLLLYNIGASTYRIRCLTLIYRDTFRIKSSLTEYLICSILTLLSNIQKYNKIVQSNTRLINTFVKIFRTILLFANLCGGELIPAGARLVLYFGRSRVSSLLFTKKSEKEYYYLVVFSSFSLLMVLVLGML